MAAWRKTREQRETEHHEAVAKLEADQAELRQPDADGRGPVAYAARSFLESAMLLLGAAALCVVAAVIGAVVAGTLGLFLGFLVGLAVCGVLAVVGFGYGAAAWRREHQRRG